MGMNLILNPSNEGFEYRLSALEKGAVPIAKKAVYDGAGAVADAVKMAAPRNTGDLADSVGISKIKAFADVVSTNVGFNGYDGRGVPNMLKARALESGRRGKYKHPFFRKAVNGAREKCLRAMEKTVDNQIRKTMEV